MYIVSVLCLTVNALVCPRAGGAFLFMVVLKLFRSVIYLFVHFTSRFLISRAALYMVPPSAIIVPYHPLTLRNVDLAARPQDTPEYQQYKLIKLEKKEGEIYRR